MAESKLRTHSIDFAVQILDLENLPSKFLPCKLTFWGGRSENAGKFQAYRHKELVNRNSKIVDGNCAPRVLTDASIGLVPWHTRAAARMDLYIKYLG